MRITFVKMVQERSVEMRCTRPLLFLSLLYSQLKLNCLGCSHVTGIFDSKLASFYESAIRIGQNPRTKIFHKIENVGMPHIMNHDVLFGEIQIPLYITDTQNMPETESHICTLLSLISLSHAVMFFSFYFNFRSILLMFSLI
jgi:hypothetical protein